MFPSLFRFPQLDALTLNLYVQFSPIEPVALGFLDEFLDANLNEFVFIPDSLTESMPILSIILENETIRVLAKDL